MQLASCRALKEEIRTRAYDLATEAVQRRDYSTRAIRGKPRRKLRSSESSPVAAVGIAPGKGKEYRLAVRIARGSERYQSRLLRGLDRHESEIDLALGVRYAPRITLRAGGSIGHYKITAGTLGGFVEDDDNFYMLSNNHVLANSNQCFGGDPIVQPGPADATATPSLVGRLANWFPLSKTDRTGVDAATATFSDRVDFFEPWNYSGIGQIGKNPVSNRFSVSRVIKKGRTTGITRGTVSAFDLDGVQIDYGTPSDPAIVTFDSQIELIGAPPAQPFSQPGDSGSFVIDRDSMQAYALLYGGGVDSMGIDRTLAHFMPDVLSKMQVRLVQ